MLSAVIIAYVDFPPVVRYFLNQIYQKLRNRIFQDKQSNDYSVAAWFDVGYIDRQRTRMDTSLETTMRPVTQAYTDDDSSDSDNSECTEQPEDNNSLNKDENIEVDGSSSPSSGPPLA